MLLKLSIQSYIGRCRALTFSALQEGLRSRRGCEFAHGRDPIFLANYENRKFHILYVIQQSWNDENGRILLKLMIEWTIE
jgi:hypothetical protein